MIMWRNWKMWTKRGRIGMTRRSPIYYWIAQTEPINWEHWESGETVHTKQNLWPDQVLYFQGIRELIQDLKRVTFIYLYPKDFLGFLESFRGFTVLESLAKGFGDFQRVSERFQYFSHDFKQFLRSSYLFRHLLQGVHFHWGTKYPDNLD